MLHTTDKIIKPKVGLLDLAEELGNVSKSWQVMGLSRDTYSGPENLDQNHQKTRSTLPSYLL